MKLGTPRWWYVKSGGPAPLTRALLTPLSWIWADATRRRIALGLEAPAPVTPPGVVLSPEDFSEIYVLVKPGTPVTMK